MSTSTPHPDHPVVLFDGVCNLCNAWVRWLLEHDPEGRYRLASLQSAAAREVLAARLTPEEIAELPDAIVLVDASGVHTRSAAVLRIAGGLGWPWKALSAFRAVPAFARDAVYRLVARNRYRWFGHRDTCMLPSPEVMERFLDAAEPRQPIETQDPADRGAGAPTPLRSWALRLVIAYLIIYMLPFPLTLLGNLTRVPLLGDIPGLGTVIGWLLVPWSALTNWVTTFTGNVLFGVQVAPSMTGSGDQTFNYVELVADLGLALVAATVWTVAARARRVSGTTFDISRVWVRYYLGGYLLIYGWVKLFPLQMPPPGPDRLLQPYGDSSPMGIAWTFIGASLGYQMFSGFCEAVAGYLLFWRRTALLGSLIAMAVLLNVMAINYFYDVPVKLFSTHLFLCALFIAAPDLPRMVGMFGFNLPVASDARVPFWRRWGWSPRAVGVATLGFVAMLTWFHVQDGVAQSRSRGVWAETSRLEGIYVVESFVQDGQVDRENEDDARWVRVGVNMPSVTTIQRATGEAERMLMSIDTAAHTVSFYGRGEQAPPTPQFSYEEPEEGVLRLEGSFAGKPTVVVMRKSPSDALLVGRGFRWINEFPFNR
ncbi:MAG TPA: thiol-disulfide oxidoreductase DCC family protein [Longimicrobiales bacterium]|nr:thiol-disulfide oxidoreductase DCC family protein [Longimicrobiales bacterium]